jgi:regulator of replication initiation timing
MREAREKLKLSIVEENRQLKLENAKLVAENEKLKRD